MCKHILVENLKPKNLEGNIGKRDFPLSNSKCSTTFASSSLAHIREPSRGSRFEAMDDVFRLIRWLQRLFENLFVYFSCQPIGTIAALVSLEEKLNYDLVKPQLPYNNVGHK